MDPGHATGSMRPIGDFSGVVHIVSAQGTCDLPNEDGWVGDCGGSQLHLLVDSTMFLLSGGTKLDPSWFELS